MLRDIGTIKAREGRYKQRRLSIDTQPRIRTQPYHVNYSRYYTPYHVHNIPYIQDPMTRTLIIVPHLESTNQAPLPNSDVESTNRNPLRNFRLLRVLDSLTSSIEFDPNELFCLRYLAIRYNIPRSLFRLHNLQTLIISGPRIPFHQVYNLHLKIWKMPSLRHLTTKSPCFLKQPSMLENVRETNMQTLSLVANLKLSTRTIKMLVNLRKLDLYYYREVGQDGSGNYQISNLIHLEKLEELKIVFLNVGCWRADLELAFPSSLKKLTFYNFGLQISTNIVEYLPSVEMLKLRGKICRGGQWNPVEDHFLKLRYMELRSVNVRDWGADSMHFPRLEVLVLKVIGENLKEIPCGIGEIDMLKLIELHRCHPSIVASAKQIQADQLDMGNEDFQVRVFDR